MCRSIKQLRKKDNTPTDEEIYLASLQFVRKVSGFRAPSQANAETFNRAVQEIAASTRKMLNQLTVAPHASTRHQ